MHPAPSLILFTALSGLGLGTLCWALLALAQDPAATTAVALAWIVSGLGLALSSAHLKNPKNAWRAFTQPGSSWLSREAWLAVATMAITPPVAWSVAAGGAPGLVVLPIALALATVAATAMIYTQLKTVPRWHSPWTPAVFVALALAGGALPMGQTGAGAALLVLAGLALTGHWMTGDSRVAAGTTNLQTATGLTNGTVRAFEPPHTGTNYLLREMVHVVARKHAMRLRVIGFGLAIVLPLLLLVAVPAVPPLLVLAVHLAGVLTTRWLFFAEAEHVVGHYYGLR